MEDIKTEVCARILTRNQTQTRAYESLISNCTHHTDAKLLKTYKDVRSRNAMCERENIVLSKSGSDPKQLQEIQDKTRELEGQLGRIYRDKSENLTAVMTLREAKKNISIEANETAEKLKKITAQVAILTSETTEKSSEIHLLEEKKSVLQSEFSSLQEKLQKVRVQNESLVTENGNLALRLAHIKETQSKQLLEISECYESVLKKQQLSELSENSSIAMDENGGFSSIMVKKRVELPRSYKYKLVGHAQDITSCVYNDAGSVLVTTGGDCMVKLWDTEQGVERKVLRGLVHPALSVDVSVGTELVLAGSADMTAVVWRLGSARVIHTLTGHTSQVTSVRFLSTKRMATTGSQDRTIKLWDIERGFTVKTLMTYSSCQSVALSSEDSLLASGHYDGKVRIWSPSNGEAIAEVDVCDQASVTCVSFSKDGRQLVASSNDNKLSLLDTRNFSLIGCLTHPEYRCQHTLTKVCWSSDSDYVLAGSNDGRVHLWNAVTREIEEIYEGGHGNPVTCVAWSPAKQQFASVDTVGGLVFWE